MGVQRVVRADAISAAQPPRARWCGPRSDPNPERRAPPGRQQRGQREDERARHGDRHGRDNMHFLLTDALVHLLFIMFVGLSSSMALTW